MKTAAVYNEYWATGGGGETFCGGIAESLDLDGFDVTLLASADFDVEQLSERLSLDLTGCRLEVVDGGPMEVAEASGRFDLFVNGSYLSSVRNRATTGIYVVHFPGSRPPSSWVGSLARFIPAEGIAQPVQFTWGDGFHAPDPGAAGAVWTSGRAQLDLDVKESVPLRLRLLFGHLRPPAAGPANVTIAIDGEVLAEGVIPAAQPGPMGRARGRFGTEITVPFAGAGRRCLELEADTFVPAELGLGSDVRPLGVPLRGVTAGSRSTRIFASIAPNLYHRMIAPSTPAVVSSYDVVASNSEFTRGFVEDWWSIDESPVLHPPVQLRPRSTAKQQSIVAVGRFFDSSSGHSKKQIELLQAFRRLRAQGIDDWSLTFVGGCDAQAAGYLDSVRREADELPVEFLIDASGAERDQAIGRASIFWHAAGFGEDAELHPDRMEHFGISTVEAMSTGAIPIVFAGGGQLEIVRDGVSGFHFRTLDELVAHTRRLVCSPDERDRLSDGAALRARDFGFETFRRNLHELVDVAVARGSEKT